jgi:hypothetical protein
MGFLYSKVRKIFSEIGGFGMLKLIEYGSSSMGDARALYFLECLNRICVYSGITRYTGSTINYAEVIIHAICKKENISLDQINFFDLQTCLGYCKKPGEFECDRIYFKLKNERIENISWGRTNCPAKVLKIFSKLIQGEAPKIIEVKKRMPYVGPFIIELIEGVPTSKVPKQAGEVNGSEVHVRRGMVGQALGGIQMVAGGIPLAWGYKYLKSIRTPSGEYVWANKDYYVIK